MFIARVRSKGKDGKSYQSVLLRESFRLGNKVASRTLAVLTKLPQWLIAAIELAILQRRDLSLPQSPLSPTEAIVSFVQPQNQASLRIVLKESFGALWLVKQIADDIGITKALSFSATDHDATQIALWRVCARVLTPGLSLLATARLAASSAARRLFSWQSSWCEDDLYSHHGAWLEQKHAAIELALWKSRRNHKIGGKIDLFLYDVTSSYFEGTENELSAFGYNRDGKKGKMQVVVGLLTDGTGDPCAIKVYSGETRDFRTFGDAVHHLKDRFGCRHVVMVGDRGMIKSEQIQDCRDIGFHYISSLTKPQINKLLKTGVIQMELFDQPLAEVMDKAGCERYVLRRNTTRRDEVRQNRKERGEKMVTLLGKSNKYLEEHPNAQAEVQFRRMSEWVKKLSLNTWLSVEIIKGKRRIKLKEDAEALREEEKLDGCYAIRTDLKKKDCLAEVVHDRYKDLAKVEEDFRTMKTGHLEIRPFYVIKEENTHAHALTAMLSLKIRRHLYEAWKGENLTVEEGLKELASLSILELEVIDKGTAQRREILPEPTDLQQRLLKLAGVTLPKVVPEKIGAVVVTRKALQSERQCP